MLFIHWFSTLKRPVYFIELGDVRLDLKRFQILCFMRFCFVFGGGGGRGSRVGAAEGGTGSEQTKPAGKLRSEITRKGLKAPTGAGRGCEEGPQDPERSKD